MKEREIKRALQKSAASQRCTIPQRRDENIRVLLETAYPVITRAEIGGFIRDQLGFLSRSILLFHAAWMALFMLALKNQALLGIPQAGLCLLSALPPLLMLFSVEQVSRIHNRSMLEIECATKYSLQKAVLIRMAIVSSANLIAFVTGICVAARDLQLCLLEAIVYGLTPMTLEAVVLLKCMRHFSGMRLNIIALALYCLTAIMLVAGNDDALRLFAPEFFKEWLVALPVGVALCVYQFVKTNACLRNFEELI